MPAPPKGLDAESKRIWRESFRDLATEGTWRPSDRRTLERYVLAGQTARRARREAKGETTAIGSQGQPVQHPALKIATSAERDEHQLAEALGLTPEARRRRARDEPKPLPDGPIGKRLPRLKWRLPDFIWFCSQLRLPDGRPFVLEPFQLFILKFVFAVGMVELLILLPKGNGKTTLFAALSVYHLLITTNAECFILAADKEQADEMYRFAQHYVDQNVELEARMVVTESTRRIRRRDDQGFIRVIASDSSKGGGKKHSFNPTLALIDELHAHENDNAYVAMRSAAFKRGGLVLNCSTAGHDHRSTLGQLRKGMRELDQHGGRVRKRMKVNRRGQAIQSKRDGRLTICEAASGRTAMLEWACEPKDDLSDPTVVKRANPASFVTLASIEDAREAPGITPWAFARYRANVWTLGFKSWLPGQVWDDLGEPTLQLIEGAGLFVAVDMARYRDCAAVAAVQPREGVADAVKAKIWKSGGEDDPIDYELVKAHLRELDSRYRLLAVGYDPKYFDQSAAELAAEGLPMVKFSQSNERMCPAWANLREAILRGRLRHDGDPVLAAHVNAGRAKDVGDEFKVTTQSNAGPHIDGAVALAMANQLANFRKPKRRPFVEVIA